MAQINNNKINQLEILLSEILDGHGYTHGLERSLRKLRKELELYQNHMNALPGHKRFDKKYPKVQLGGGKHTLQGFLNIDVIPPADLICDIREGIPLRDRSTKFIFTEHFLEHVDYPTSVKKVIKEGYRILEPGGKIIIGVPDGELAMRSYIKRDKKYFDKMLATWYKERNCLGDFNTYVDLVNYIFRDQDDDAEFSSHLWAFDFEKLKSLLNDAGFKKIKPWKFDNRIANTRREWGSIYVSAIR